MFDSIKFYLPQERASNTDMLAQTPVHLQNITEHKKAGRIHYSGYLDNLKIYVSERGVSIKGSLAKYFLGDNIKTLRRSDSEQAISKLSDDLHLPVNEADVSRIDFAHNFKMEYEPTTYYRYLGEHQYLTRYLNAKSLYYNSSNRTLLFYDKLAEAKKDRSVSIPELLKEKNLLRYEISYKRRLGKQLKKPEITASTLFDEEFYIKLTDRYIADYQSIHKIPKTPLNLNKMDTLKDWWNQKALQQIQADGVPETMQEIEELRARDTFNSPESYSRLKRQVRDRLDRYKKNDSTPLIQELDKKISKVKRFYR